MKQDTLRSENDERSIAKINFSEMFSHRILKSDNIFDVLFNMPFKKIEQSLIVFCSVLWSSKVKIAALKWRLCKHWLISWINFKGFPRINESPDRTTRKYPAGNKKVKKKILVFQLWIMNKSYDRVSKLIAVHEKNLFLSILANF